MTDVNDYCVPDDIKAHMPDIDFPTTYEVLLARLCTRASRLVDNYCRVRPGAFEVDEDETFHFDGSGKDVQWFLDEVGEHHTLAKAPSEVAVSETGAVGASDYVVWAATDYHQYPLNALANGRPLRYLTVDILNGTKSIFYNFPRSVRIKGFFGISQAIPDDVRQAAIIQAVRWLKRGQQGFQDAGASVRLGQLTFILKLDPDLKTLLDPWVELGI